MRVILLPGMDGTGMLFRPFLQALGRQLPHDTAVQVISYPCEQELTYGQLIEYVKNRLPVQENFILVAESFSGPVGYALASRQPNRIKAVIFAATFLSPPRGILWKIPPRLTAPLMKLPLPIFLLKALLFERDTADETVALFRAAVQQVQPSVLAARMREMITLRIEKRPLEMPCVYIRAGHDRLISGSHTEEFRGIAPNIKVVDIPGPHFIIQTMPEECAKVVRETSRLCHPMSLPPQYWTNLEGKAQKNR